MWPSVSVPVLSVNSTRMFPRSSMHTRRLTITLRFESRREPVARLTVTIAGSSWGVRPTAIAKANSADSRIDRPRTALIKKIEPARQAVTVASIREVGQAILERRLWVCPPRLNAIPPNALPEPV